MPGNTRTVVIGSINVDESIRLDRLPAPGETIAAKSASQGLGGKGANQAVAAAVAGADVHLVARVGTDASGLRARRSLEEWGVDTTTVLTDEDPTGHALVFVQSSGENSIVVVSGANARLSGTDVDAAASLIQRAGAVVLQGEVAPRSMSARWRWRPLRGYASS